MDTKSDQPSGLTPVLREFLGEPAHGEAWEPSASPEPLAECGFQVEEQVLGEAGSRLVPEGGLRLNRVTYLQLAPDDLSALAGYRAGLENAQLVLAMFWFALTELPARRSYDSLRIRVRLQPPAPVLLLSPDRAGGAGPAWRAIAAEIAAIVAGLVPDGLAATGLDLGDDGFGWEYETSDDGPLVPHRFNTVVILELPSAADGLVGLLDADARISRSVLGRTFPRKATLVHPAVPIDVPFAESRPARPGQPGGQRATRGGERRRQAREGSPPERYDLGLIVPLREEFDSVREVFSFGSQVNENGSYRYPFSVPGSALRGVAVVLFGMGPTLTAVQAANLLGRFDLPVLALVGIAGALDRDLRLGDVVVASLVDPYLDRAKARPGPDGEGIELDSGGSAWQAGRNVVSFANNFRYRAAEHEEYAGWRSRARARRDAQGLPGDGALARDEPDYTVDAVASGDIVAASAEFSRWLRGHHRRCAAIEMEASGVAQAVYEHGQADMLVVRGISDFADERKAALDSAEAADASHGAWRRYAALNAADLLAAMLRDPDFPWPS
jgi:nucleoside phosphorylase